MRAILITPAKTYERPSSALQHISDRLHTVLNDLRAQKFLKIAMGVFFSLLACYLVTSAVLRFQESRLAYKYLELVTRSIPYSAQQ
jgi:hypothetical protein